VDVARFLVGALLVSFAAGRASSQVAWSYKADDGRGPASGPLALWSKPETMAFNVLRCNARERLLEFEDIEAEEFAGGRPIRFEAGGRTWVGEERMEPPDGVPVSVARLPLDHPVVTAIARGAPIRISGTAGTFLLPNHRVVRRVIRECRSAVRP
jgi:hypothetical protein